MQLAGAEKIAILEPGKRSERVEAAQDSLLMGRVRDGDVGTLAVLFERHHRSLFQFFSRLTGNREAAEDLVQDVFFRILKYRLTYQPGSQFTTWMYQIARNAHLDQVRKKKIELPLPDPAEDRGWEPVSNENSAEQKLSDSQEAKLLRRALAALPEDKREVLLLSRYQHLKYEEIGEIMQCDARTVKVRVFRAIRELGRHYFALAGEKAS
jgi:RNA polymerase sigma-70 factor (ECF subfamily)